jgi:membrane protein YqaA with SNARE-associated domain
MRDARPFDARHEPHLFLAAFVWGVAEGTLFFVVPDVLLTWIALRDRRRALDACLAATAGAVCGGLLMAVLGHAHPHAMLAWLDKVPAVNAHLIDQARSAMHRHGGLALLEGAFSGVPYKLFAAQARAAGLSLPALLIWTVPARLSRFVLLTLVANAVARWLRPRTHHGVVVAVWALGWSVNYALYWSLLHF